MRDAESASPHVVMAVCRLFMQGASLRARLHLRRLVSLRLYLRNRLVGSGGGGWVVG